MKISPFLLTILWFVAALTTFATSPSAEDAREFRGILFNLSDDPAETITQVEAHAHKVNPEDWRMEAAQKLGIVASRLKSSRRIEDSITVAERAETILSAENIRAGQSAEARAKVFATRAMIRELYLFDSVGAEADYQAALDLGAENPEWQASLDKLHKRNQAKLKRDARFRETQQSE